MISLWFLINTAWPISLIAVLNCNQEILSSNPLPTGGVGVNCLLVTCSFPSSWVLKPLWFFIVAWHWQIHQECFCPALRAPSKVSIHVQYMYAYTAPPLNVLLPLFQTMWRPAVQHQPIFWSSPWLLVMHSSSACWIMEGVFLLQTLLPTTLGGFSVGLANY